MDDSLYERARDLLRANPDWGKKRLGDAVGVKTPTSRRLIHRYRGETAGHNEGDPIYQRVRELREKNPDYGAQRIAEELRITVDHALLHLARFRGAQEHGKSSNSVPNSVTKTEVADDGFELQDTQRDGSRDLCYRGTRIQTLEDLLVYTQVDTRVWEVERHVKNQKSFRPPDSLCPAVRPGRLASSAGDPKPPSVPRK